MRNDKLYLVALQCADLNAKGCNNDCRTCKYNVFDYTDDIKYAALLKATAYTDYFSHTKIKKKKRSPIAIVAIVIVSLSLLSATLSMFKDDDTYEYIAPQQTVDNNDFSDELIAEAKYLLNNPNNVRNIPRVLALMHGEGLSVNDMNNDGLINCIDYTLVFRLFYGSNARIIHNNNPPHMNHMFIRVLYNSYEYIDVEPQGTVDMYSMGVIWGMQYNPKYNKDVTSQWTHVVGGM